MSFSKLRDEQFTDNTYAVRDLSSSKNFYMQQMQKDKFCGWLKKDGENYIVEDCGEPSRIHHKQIDIAYNIDFASKFQKVGFEKTSEYKYNLIGGAPRKINVSDNYKSVKNPKYDKRLFCKYEKNGKEGILVLTGQPTARQDNGKMGDGKGFEFIFFNKDKKEEIILDKKIFNDFLFAYFDQRTTEPKESLDWTFWKKRLNNGEKIPIFFQKEGKRILHFGLSFLYKLPYKHSIKDGIPDEHFNNEKLDLAQTIFGYVDNKKALKGRVQFSHFIATNDVKELAKRKEILGTPRASYYPMYVQQKDNDLFTTFMKPFSISGRKRYPIHNGTKVQKTKDTGNDNVGTTFKPLKEGVIFEGKMRYHNLKKAELGSILSALTFHNTENTYHNIGLAKSLGYGKIEIKIDGIENITDYLKEFELKIIEQIDNWKDTQELKELLTMATEQQNQGNSLLKYIELEEFAKYKTEKNQQYLKPYSKLTNIKSVEIKSFISDKDIENAKINHQKSLIKQKELEEAKIAKKIFDDKLKEAETTDNIQIIKNFIIKYPDYQNIDKIQKRLDDLYKFLYLASGGFIFLEFLHKFGLITF